MEFNSRFFSFKIGRDRTVQKADTEKKPSLPDEFVTQIVNWPYSNSFHTNLDLLLFFFNNVAEINSLVTYIAQKGADIPVKHVRLLGNGKEKDISKNSPFLKLLSNPNEYNRGMNFMINCISSFLVFGFIPLNTVKSIGWEDEGPLRLYLMPGNMWYPIPEKSINLYGLPAPGVDYRMNQIKMYRYFVDNRPINFAPEEVIMINDSNLNFTNGEYMRGRSRLQSAIRSVQTLSDLYDTVNTLISGKGAEGIVHQKRRAGSTDIGWDEDDKKKVEKKFYSYGKTSLKDPIAFSSQDLGFLRISVPIGEFLPVELKEHEFRTLARQLLFPSVLLNDKEGAIYNNVAQAESAFYTTCLQPIVNLIYSSLTEDFGLKKINEALKPDWTQIECLQEDEKEKAERNKVWNEVFKELWENNLCTRNQWLSHLGLPEINEPEFNLRRDQLPEEQQGTEPANDGNNGNNEENEE